MREQNLYHRSSYFKNYNFMFANFRINFFSQRTKGRMYEMSVGRYSLNSEQQMNWLVTGASLPLPPSILYSPSLWFSYNCMFCQMCFYTPILLSLSFSVYISFPVSLSSLSVSLHTHTHTHTHTKWADSVDVSLKFMLALWPGMIIDN